MRNKPTDRQPDTGAHDRQIRRAFGNRGTVASRLGPRARAKPVKLVALLAAPVMMVLRPVATKLTDGWWRRKLMAWIAPLGVIIGATNEQVGLFVGTLVTVTMLVIEALASRMIHKSGGGDEDRDEIEYDDEGIPKARRAKSGVEIPPVAKNFWGPWMVALLALATVLQFASCKSIDGDALKDAASNLGAHAGARISGGEISIYLRYGDLFSAAKDRQLDGVRYDECDEELLRREEALIRATK